MTALARTSDPLGYWKPKAKPESVSEKKLSAFRLDPALKERLEYLAAFWTDLDKETLGARAAVTTTTDVVVRLLENGLDGAWAEIGVEPKNDRERAALLKKAAAVRRSFIDSSK